MAGINPAPASHRMSRFGNLEFDGQAESESRRETALDEESQRRGEAEAALRRGDFELALRKYGQMLESNARSVAAWVGQVRMLVELGEFKEAALWADRALEQAPQEPELLAAKAVTLARAGDLKAALVFSDAAIAEQGDTPYVWLARGDVLLARAERRAEYCFLRALAAGAGDWLWSWLASRIHYFHRKFSLALKLVTQALALDGSQAVIWLQLGRCQLALGLAEGATESFDQARELDPQCAAARTLAGASRDQRWWPALVGRWRRWLNR